MGHFECETTISDSLVIRVQERHLMKQVTTQSFSKGKQYRNFDIEEEQIFVTTLHSQFRQKRLL